MRYLFVALAVFGLLASLVVHITSLLGLLQLFHPVMTVLHLGIFVVFFPAVISLGRRQPSFWERTTVRDALRGCPPWMVWLTYGFLGYAMVNFLLVLGWPPGSGPLQDSDSARAFSGHWMAFYSVSAAVHYSAIREAVGQQSTPSGGA